MYLSRKIAMKLIRYSFVPVLVSLILAQSPCSAGISEIPSDRYDRHQSRIFIPQSSRSPVFYNMTVSNKMADISDLCISETVSPATFSQKFSSTAPLTGDKMIVVWQDIRLGSYKIFAQIIDASGNVVSGNSMVIGRSDGYNLIEPKAVADGSGGFFMAWRDEITGRIYAARYGSTLTQLVAPFVVNDTVSDNYAGPFDIDCYSDGRLVVTWEEYSTTNYIALRIFNSIGTPVTSTLKINSDVSALSHWVPAVAINKGGGIAVAWEDYRNGNADIYMRLLNQDGSYNGDDFSVVEASSDDSAQYQPDLVYSSIDGYAIAWLDRRDGTQRVYLQKVLPGTGLVGGNSKISDDDPSALDWDISMAVNSTGYLVMGWTVTGALEKIIVQRFSSGFTPSGSKIIVNNYTTGSRWETSLAISTSNKIFITWTDYRAGNSDIYLGLLSSLGVPQFTSDKLVNDDSLGALSVEPDIAAIDLSKSAAVFTSSRYDDGDIYLQMVAFPGNLVGNNQKINTDTIPTLQNEPALAVSSANMLVVWNDSRAVLGSTGSRIFGRFGTSAGSLQSSDFIISDSNNVYAKSRPAVALSRSQTGLVAWVDRRFGTGHIMGRLVKSPGTTSGSEFLISNQSTEPDNDNVVVCRDSSDIFTVVWLCRGVSGGPSAIAARYTAAGGFLNRFSFNGSISGISMTDLSAGVNDSGDVYLLWEGSDAARHLYLTIFSKSGAIKNATVEITDNTEANPQEPDITVDNNRYVVASWTDFRSGRRAVYYQVFDNNLVAVGDNTPVSAADVEFMSSSSVSGYQGLGWFVWTDPRSNGLNVYLSRILYLPTAVDDNNPDILPADFVLRQNFPNPFNPSTNIEFSLPVRSHVDIGIFNLLGQKIAILTDEWYDAGNHMVSWNGSDFTGRKAASGIYLYRMKAGEFQLTRKMLLLK